MFTFELTLCAIIAFLGGLAIIATRIIDNCIDYEEDWSSYEEE